MNHMPAEPACLSREMKQVFGSSLTWVLVRGGGDLATGVAWRLHRSGFRVLITEIPEPMAVRRCASFCEAVSGGRAVVEGVTAVLARSVDDIPEIWAGMEIPVLLDPECKTARRLRPRVLVDAIMAKRNLGTLITDAQLVIGLGPGFRAGADAHCVIETNRGHFLGRVLESGEAEPDTGVPAPVMGVGRDRVIHAPQDGVWETHLEIGRTVRAGAEIGRVGGTKLAAGIDGVLRGVLAPGARVRKGMKLADIDPRGLRDLCFTVSDKALAAAGGVLEAMLRRRILP